MVLSAKPKFLLRYKPFDDLALRATYSEGYRAPNLPELFSGSFIEAAALVDPKNPQLGTQTYFVHVQGNPALRPETSYSYYTGAVWTPGASDPEHSWWGWANGFSAYVDWFQIAESNQITQLPLQQILDQENQFPGLVQRLPNGQINYINDPFVNLGAVLVDGIDFGGSYVTKEYAWGKLNIEVDASYIYNYAVQNIKNAAANTAFGSLSLTPSPVFAEDDSYALPDLKLTGTNPPFTDNGYGFDPATANAFGRYYYVEVEKKF